MGLRIQGVWSVGLRIQVSGFWISGPGFRASGSGVEGSGSGSGVRRLEFRVQGARTTSQSPTFKVQGVGCMAQHLPRITTEAPSTFRVQN